MNLGTIQTAAPTALALLVMVWFMMILIAFIHEAGHYLAGKALNMKGIKIRLTYGGGGRTDFDESAHNDSIWSHPKNRILIASSGALLNLLLGCLTLSAYLWLTERVEHAYGTPGFLPMAHLGLFATGNIVAFVGSLFPSKNSKNDSSVVLAAFKAYRAGER